MTNPLIPNPLENDSQYNRYYHYDISHTELSDLWDELHALRPLLWGLPQDDWLRQRLRELENEVAKRKYGDKQPAKAKPKPKRLVEGVKL